VYFVGPQNDAMVMGATLYEGLAYSPDVRTTVKQDGTFELSSSEASGRLLFLHGDGYAIVPAFGFKPGQNTTLVPWARIEGTYRPGGKARPAVQVTAEAIRPLVAMTSGDRLTFSLSVTTDAEGRFIFEHVPAMQLRVGARTGLGLGAAKMVQIEAGRTNVVTLADDGPPATGQVDLLEVIAANPPARGLDFDTSTSWVRAIRVEPRPELPNGVDADDWESQLNSVLDGKASDTLTLPAIFAELKPGGSFAFDALAPGKYVLLVEIHGERAPNTCGWGLVLARGRADFIVADSAVKLPIVKLQAPSHPEPGGAAPALNGTTADGADFALSDLRGKFVVLDFWAGWCVPCRTSQPVLQAIHRKYKDRVAFVGLNFDYTDLKAKRAIDSIKSPWTQVLAGPWDANNETLLAFGVEVIPSIWLIDPAGKVIAKQLTHEDLDQHLAKALRK
jgi:thiol-disulfide isomerase/thioredoxin